MKTKLIVITILFFSMHNLQAQDAITGSGGNASGLGGSISYSVGQIVYTTISNSNGSVSQGIQQPYEISSVTGIKEALGISLEINAYPNPTADILTLKVEDYGIQHLSYKLFSVSGILLENKNVESNETSIMMKSLSPSSYFLIVYDNQKEVKTFQIIKN